MCIKQVLWTCMGRNKVLWLFTSLPVTGEIAGVNTASQDGCLLCSKNRTRQAGGFHDELNDLERDGVHQVVPCPWVTMIWQPKSRPYLQTNIVGRKKQQPWVTSEILDLCDRWRGMRKKKIWTWGIREKSGSEQQYQEVCEKAIQNWTGEQCNETGKSEEGQQ